ncbi:MAG: DegT/DnrJ/EryC1/StrS family aminotransferase [Gemmatimonadota bacterium]|nr:DegT/DnrJ/EryC1/StrS family aminotransferase [Gemmatimonadota bacterium]
MQDNPEIPGGIPVFDERIHIVKPRLPQWTDIADGCNCILTSGMVTKGTYLQQFEQAVAAHLHVNHAIGVSSCTSGLMLSYQALGLTGEVIVPSFTFMATVSALVWANLKPVYVDVNRDTTNILPEAIEGAITPDTSAIVAIHNFGNPAEIDALEQIARQNSLNLIFDAAHGFGTRYRGAPVGGQGDAHVYSLSPTKLLIAGEGGVVATNNDELAEHVRMGREYGNSGAYDSAFAGMNARLAEFNALLGLRSLDMLEQAAGRRNEIVELYHRELGDLPGIGFQKVDTENRCSYKDFSITVDPDAFGMSRDELAESLAAANIDSRKYYDPPVHRQQAYRQFASPDRPLPHTEWLSDHSLCLPVWSHMDEKIVLGICEAVHRIYRTAPAVSL